MENITAKVSCFARAYHYNNNQTHIFADNMASTVLGDEYDQIAESMSQGLSFFMPDFKGTKEEGLRLIVDNQLSPSVLGRSAYCEKMLKNEIGLGCSQYVIFASGYDTYSLRNKVENITVFELDLPVMIEDKMSRVSVAGITNDSVMVPCNLAEPVWVEKLLSSGYERDRKSFGSLLGICYYLESTEWKNLLMKVAEIMPTGSAVCFDYPNKDESNETKVNKALASGAGEQMKTLYTYEDMEKLLSECGFNIYEHLDSKEMTEQYFVEYNNRNPEHPMVAPTGVGYILAVRQ